MFTLNETTAQQRWDKLDGSRKGLLDRCELYSRWTIPKIFPPSGREQNHEALTHDFQSLGAQCCNSLSNRLVMGLFAPSRPFFRLTPTLKKKREMTQIPAAQQKLLDNGLSVVEKDASDVIDNLAVRTKLYDMFKHLLITGNAMMVMDDKSIRILGLRNYVVLRDNDGAVRELIIKERVHKDALDKNARIYCESVMGFKSDADDCVNHFRWIKVAPNGFTEVQWVENVKLPMEFNSKYTAEDMPYRAVTWDLASGDHYGTGLVEDNQADFAALSALSKATIQAAILASQFKWLVNPMGMTTPEDFVDSENGAAIPGKQGDVTPLAANLDAKLQTNLAVNEVYVNRIGAAFMLQSAVTRHAERVTTYELRMNAEELEGGLGGAYSRIAADVQLPMAHWCLKRVDRSVLGKEIQPTIVTGLAALSRVGDRDRLGSFLQGSAVLANIPDDVRGRLRVDVILADLASAEGFARDTYVMDEAEYQEQQTRQMARAQQMALEQIMAKQQGAPEQ